MKRLAAPPSCRRHGLFLGTTAMLLALAPAARTASEESAPEREAVVRKIEFDVSKLDAEGLRGPPGGKVAVDYEFAIPDTDECKARVKAADPSVRFMPGARGRVGARPGQCLCVGSTHQPNFRPILEALAALPCVERIIECHWE